MKTLSTEQKNTLLWQSFETEEMGLLVTALFTGALKTTANSDIYDPELNKAYVKTKLKRNMQVWIDEIQWARPENRSSELHRIKQEINSTQE